MTKRRLLALATAALAVTSAAALTANGASATAARALDLHHVSWSSVMLPGATCGSSRPIQLHRLRGARNVESTAFFSPIPKRWARDDFYGKRGVSVDAGWDPVVYGDLADSGHDDAGLVFDCNNGGGTADGVLLEGWVIFSGSAGRLTVVGIVTPRVQPANVLPTLEEISITPGKIVAHEVFYGPDDPTAGGSGRATTVWTYAHGRLHPGVPVITRHANTSPN
ncbi:MAG TPA: hypothetical protein VHX66_12390 [Solirubrobacteraceae bacterium]|nr:hypothetical protein [Solirubrobacteraceae bacterium]